SMRNPLLLVEPCTRNHTGRQSVHQFLIFSAVWKTTAAKTYDHVDIMSRNVTATNVAEIFIFPEIRADFFRHLCSSGFLFCTASGGDRHHPHMKHRASGVTN